MKLPTGITPACAAPRYDRKDPIARPCLRRGPLHWEYYVRVADNGDVEGALKDYTQAIRFQPDYAKAYYNRAGILKSRGQHEMAISDYQKYLDLGRGIRDGDQGEVEQIIRELRKQV